MIFKYFSFKYKIKKHFVKKNELLIYLLTSLDCIRYRTIRPLKTARVLLSKSGKLTPKKSHKHLKMQLLMQELNF